MWQKIRVAEFFFVASLESNEYLRKATACFIKTLSLTAYKKQTTQLIKILRHGRKPSDVARFSPLNSDRKRTQFMKQHTFGK